MHTTVKGRSTTEDDITAEVLRRFEGTPDERLREIVFALLRHLHGFVKDVNLTEAQWFSAIQFLTATGQPCDGKRQEFILLSDTLGVSMLVDLLNYGKQPGSSESTVLGPFFAEGAPEIQIGGSIVTAGTPGETAVVTGSVKAT